MKSFLCVYKVYITNMLETMSFIILDSSFGILSRLNITQDSKVQIDNIGEKFRKCPPPSPLRPILEYSTPNIEPMSNLNECLLFVWKSTKLWYFMQIHVDCLGGMSYYHPLWENCNFSGTVRCPLWFGRKKQSTLSFSV